MTALSLTMPELEFPFHNSQEEAGQDEEAATALALQCLSQLPQSQLNCWLLCAARKGRLQLLQSLLDTGANPNTEDDYGYTALMFLAAQGSEEGVQMMLSSPRCIVNKRSGSMQTALHFATEKGHSKCVEMLLEAGAMVNASDDWATPLIMAVNSGCLRSVEVLLAAGGNVEMTDLKGFTALMHAAAIGNVHILRCLLSHGSCPHKMNKTSALHQAAKFGHLQCLDVLLEIGVSPDGRDVDMFLPIELAVQTDQAPVVSRLLQCGAAGRKETEMVLAAAAKHNAVNSLQALLECGCSPQATDHRGIPAVVWAVSQTTWMSPRPSSCTTVMSTRPSAGSTLFNTELQDMCATLGEDSLTPLAIAARRGYDRLLKSCWLQEPILGAWPSAIVLTCYHLPSPIALMKTCRCIYRRHLATHRSSHCAHWLGNVFEGR